MSSVSSDNNTFDPFILPQNTLSPTTLVLSSPRLSIDETMYDHDNTSTYTFPVPDQAAKMLISSNTETSSKASHSCLTRFHLMMTCLILNHSMNLKCCQMRTSSLLLIQVPLKEMDIPVHNHLLTSSNAWRKKLTDLARSVRH